MLKKRFNKGLALHMKTPFWTGEIWGLVAVNGKICTKVLTGASPRVCQFFDCTANYISEKGDCDVWD
jgi:hypothetical protein